jgi:hypothetical protein
MHDELKYYGANGQRNAATLAAIGKAIIRLTK